MYRKAICIALLLLTMLSCHAGWNRKIRGFFKKVFRRHQTVVIYKDFSPYMSTEDEWTDFDETTILETDWSSSDLIKDDAPPSNQEGSGSNHEPCDDYIEIHGINANKNMW